MKSLSRAEFRSALVRRVAQDHKGSFGHVLVVAGSRGMAGAALLCARSALRSGAGLVTLAVPGSLQAALAPRVPEALSLGLPESRGALSPEAAFRLAQAHRERGYTVLAIGPGLSQRPGTRRFLPLALSRLPLPAVLDADALNILSALGGRARELLRRREPPSILTPHPGEMARLLGLESRQVQASREACVRRLALEWGVVALLKGHGSLVSKGSRTVINPTGGPGLAKGGSGDVLAGLIAGLWAQGLASPGRTQGDLPFLAAALGAWLHGKAGELAERELGPWAMTASDVILRLPEAFKALRRYLTSPRGARVPVALARAQR